MAISLSSMGSNIRDTISIIIPPNPLVKPKYNYYGKYYYTYTICFALFI